MEHNRGRKVLQIILMAMLVVPTVMPHRSEEEENDDSSEESMPSAARVLATRRRINILDSYMSYLDIGNGDEKETVIFLHGNPTQAYLWRNVIPYVAPVARCVAPDLIGMGKSGKIDSQYRFVDHFKYLSAWIEAMDLPDKVHLVLHDWGSGLGFHWANLNRDRIKSITYMEAVIQPFPTWDDFPADSVELFQALRSSAGDELVLKNNIFVVLLQQGIIRNLTKREMKIYNTPFRRPGESRRPTLTFPREICILTEGPQDVCEIVANYNSWLKQSASVPKLYIRAEPGFLTPGTDAGAEQFPNNHIVTVKGIHFIQEDSPNEIGRVIKQFLIGLKSQDIR